jgi:hypothetical protein
MADFDGIVRLSACMLLIKMIAEIDTFECQFSGKPMNYIGIGRYFTFLTGGGDQVPSRASLLGEYRRIVRLKGSLGAGSQLDSSSRPGLSCWM